MTIGTLIWIRCYRFCSQAKTHTMGLIPPKCVPFRWVDGFITNYRRYRSVSQWLWFDCLNNSKNCGFWNRYTALHKKVYDWVSARHSWESKIELTTVMMMTIARVRRVASLHWDMHPWKPFSSFLLLYPYSIKLVFKAQECFLLGKKGSFELQQSKIFPLGWIWLQFIRIQSWAW